MKLPNFLSTFFQKFSFFFISLYNIIITNIHNIIKSRYCPFLGIFSDFYGNMDTNIIPQIKRSEKGYFNNFGAMNEMNGVYKKIVVTLRCKRKTDTQNKIVPRGTIIKKN